jgi:hypothetical protein
VAIPHLHLTLLAVVMCAIASANCDDNDTFASSSPTGPTFTAGLSGPPSVGSFSTGTVISGRVSGSDFSSTSHAAQLTAPRVGITPPGISTVVGRDGDFTLTGVPPGTVTLIFSSNGINTGILLTNVGVNQLIVLDVRVSSGVATIESEHRRSRNQTTG